MTGRCVSILGVGEDRRITKHIRLGARKPAFSRSFSAIYNELGVPEIHGFRGDQCGDSRVAWCYPPWGHFAMYIYGPVNTMPVH